MRFHLTYLFRAKALSQSLASREITFVVLSSKRRKDAMIPRSFARLLIRGSTFTRLRVGRPKFCYITRATNPLSYSSLRASTMATSSWHSDWDEEIDRKVLDIIRLAVEDESGDIHEAAEILDEAVSKGPEHTLADMWPIFVRAAEQLPHDGPAQDRLVRLMSTLRYGPDKRNTGWNYELSQATELVEDIQGTYVERRMLPQVSPSNSTDAKVS